MNYHIKGDLFPILTVKLKEGESVACRAEAASWMTPEIKLIVEKDLSVSDIMEKAAAVERFYHDAYVAESGAGVITFAPERSGQIIALDIKDKDSEVSIVRRSYLASDPALMSKLFYRRKTADKDFIMIRFYGKGTLLLLTIGEMTEKRLSYGEEFFAASDYLVAMSATCSIDVSPCNNANFAHKRRDDAARITGPGIIWLQTRIEG
jgi:uncharacterized protein (AIM24 family)